MKEDVAHGPVHYIDVGTGPAVLLLHAFPLDYSMWAPQIDFLQSDYRVIAPDIRGFGQTPAAGPWSLQEFVGDLAALLDNLGLDTVGVVGQSMGGYLALPFYAQHPHRVRRMVLADTRARADNDVEKAGRTEMIAALQQYGNPILPDRMLPRLLRPNPRPDVVQRVRRIMDGTSVEAAVYGLTAMRDRTDQSSLLYGITCPTLVIAGQHDVVTRADECREMAATIPGARFVQIPDAGHLSNMENPGAFNAALVSSL